ncbi:hypothetical protein EDB81DRAFT_439064 [Dactylonectria macrodidyma]|uniref:Uncharacterized protein n=1 Tax=Dactylonectria macrodidyma TaxID=307937 RepID=A0A9P9F672_9HYPO|nr:hypothetical protein EDB81DRAFT_439064 [Dactylonectria macrodidyma]
MSPSPICPVRQECDSLGRPCIRDYCCNLTSAWTRWSGVSPKENTHSHTPRRAFGHFTLSKPQDSCAPWSIRHPSRRQRCLSRHLPVLRLPNPSSRPVSQTQSSFPPRMRVVTCDHSASHGSRAILARIALYLSFYLFVSCLVGAFFVYACEVQHAERSIHPAL